MIDYGGKERVRDEKMEVGREKLTSAEMQKSGEGR